MSLTRHNIIWPFILFVVVYVGMTEMRYIVNRFYLSILIIIIVIARNNNIIIVNTLYYYTHTLYHVKCLSPSCRNAYNFNLQVTNLEQLLFDDWSVFVFILVSSFLARHIDINHSIVYRPNVVSTTIVHSCAPFTGTSLPIFYGLRTLP